MMVFVPLLISTSWLSAVGHTLFLTSFYLTFLFRLVVAALQYRYNLRFVFVFFSFLWFF